MSESRIFGRIARINVDGFDVATVGLADGRPVETDVGIQRGLRVGFTIEKDLDPKSPNTCEVSVYNLSRASRQRLAGQQTVPVLVEAGYVTTGLVRLFLGELREAYSKPEDDGSWITILRAGDADHALRVGRTSISVRPGVSAARVIQQQTGALGVGVGNAFTELNKQGASDDMKRLDQAVKSRGFTAHGRTGKQVEKLLHGAGMEWSIQNAEVQALARGQLLSKRAIVLSPQTGLEGSAEYDKKGTMKCRTKILPGLNPGYGVQVTRLSRSEQHIFEAASMDLDPTVYRIESVRITGDTHGDDWSADLECRDVRLGPVPKKKKTASSTTTTTPKPAPDPTGEVTPV